MIRGGFVLTIFVLASSGCGQGSLYDLDGDGYLDENDCAPTDPAIHPDAQEIYGDEVDSNCDDHDGTDQDRDGWSIEEGDCDDTNSLISPGEEDILDNETDEDCNGEADLSVPTIDSSSAVWDSSDCTLTFQLLVHDGSCDLAPYMVRMQNYNHSTGNRTQLWEMGPFNEDGERDPCSIAWQYQEHDPDCELSSENLSAEMWFWVLDAAGNSSEKSVAGLEYVN